MDWIYKHYLFIIIYYIQLHPSCPVNDQIQLVLFTRVRFRTVPNFLHRNHLPACLPQLSAGNFCPNQIFPVSRETQRSAATGLALKEYYVNVCMQITDSKGFLEEN